MKRAVIFDMDGVMIDSEIVYLGYQLEYAKTKNPDVRMEDLHPMVGRTAKDAWKVFEKAVHNGETWEELRQEYRENWNVYDQIDYKSMFRQEMIPVLERLKSSGYKLAVASSTGLPLVERILKTNGIWDYFDEVVSGNMFERSKPDPEIYCFTAGKLGVGVEECLVLEDSTVGITAAHRAGMTVAALIDDRFGFDRSLADYEIREIPQIFDILEKTA